MDYERPTDWTHHGDASIKAHGLFLTWRGHYWHVIETHPPETYGTDGHYVMHFHVKPEWVFEDGDPANGFTDAFEREIAANAAAPFDPEVFGTEEPSVPEDMEWALSNHWEFIETTICHFATSKTEKTKWEEMGDRDYWVHLGEYGIDEEMF